jgi:sulfatase maturation enzyme AslB (radical SAM superfamily)
LTTIEQHANLQELVTLTLLGGEPLYEKQNFRLLERLLELGNSNVFISIVTNGSVELSESHRHILAQFSNLNFCISIDGIGPVFEYMRYPLKWDQLLENLKFFQSITSNISASYTISNVNVPYYIETRDWFQRNNIPHNHNLVYNPEFFQPRALPQSIKSKLKQTFSDADYQSLIGDDHTQHDEQLYQQCQQELARQDRLKGIQAQDYLPAFDVTQ